MTTMSLAGGTAPITASSAQQRCDLKRVCIGWTMIICILATMTGVNGLPRGDIPSPLAWILFLPSIVALLGTGDARRTKIVQIALGITAALFVLAIARFGGASAVANCQPGLAGAWLPRGDYCPNFFEYHWGIAGKLMPVAYATMMASVAHLALYGPLQRYCRASPFRG